MCWIKKKFLLFLLLPFPLLAGERINNNQLLTTSERYGIYILRAIGAAVTNSIGKPIAKAAICETVCIQSLTGRNKVM